MDPMKLIRDRRKELKERFGMNQIGLFGSAVRDEMLTDSDVDVLVEFQPGQATFDHYMES